MGARIAQWVKYPIYIHGDHVYTVNRIDTYRSIFSTDRFKNTRKRYRIYTQTEKKLEKIEKQFDDLVKQARWDAAKVRHRTRMNTVFQQKKTRGELARTEKEISALIQDRHGDYTRRVREYLRLQKLDRIRQALQQHETVELARRSTEVEAYYNSLEKTDVKRFQKVKTRLRGLLREAQVKEFLKRRNRIERNQQSAVRERKHLKERREKLVMQKAKLENPYLGKAERREIKANIKRENAFIQQEKKRLERFLADVKKREKRLSVFKKQPRIKRYLALDRELDKLREKPDVMVYIEQLISYTVKDYKQKRQEYKKMMRQGDVRYFMELLRRLEAVEQKKGQDKKVCELRQRHYGLLRRAMRLNDKGERSRRFAQAEIKQWRERQEDLDETKRQLSRIKTNSLVEKYRGYEREKKFYPMRLLRVHQPVKEFIRLRYKLKRFAEERATDDYRYKQYRVKLSRDFLKASPDQPFSIKPALRTQERIWRFISLRRENQRLRKESTVIREYIGYRDLLAELKKNGAAKEGGAAKRLHELSLKLGKKSNNATVQQYQRNAAEMKRLARRPAIKEIRDLLDKKESLADKAAALEKSGIRENHKKYVSYAAYKRRGPKKAEYYEVRAYRDDVPYTLFVSIYKRRVTIYTIDQKKKKALYAGFQRLMRQYAMDRYGRFSEPHIDRYLSSVVRRLAPYSHRRDQTLQVRLIRSPQAFSFSAAGTVYLTTTLLKQLDGEARLAGLLAYEISLMAIHYHLIALNRERRFDDMYNIFFSGKETQVVRLAKTALKSGLIGGEFISAKEVAADRVRLARIWSNMVYRAGYSLDRARGVFQLSAKRDVLGKLADRSFNQELDSRVAKARKEVVLTAKREMGGDPSPAPRDRFQDIVFSRL